MQQMTQEDRDQVGAILRTHAEMQRLSSIQSTEALASLKLQEQTDDVVEMSEELENMIELCDDDAQNLNRIADAHFPQSH